MSSSPRVSNPKPQAAPATPNAVTPMGWMHTARFLTTAPTLEFLPALEVPEIAFVGRSNAGKSTAINTLANVTTYTDDAALRAVAAHIAAEAPPGSRPTARRCRGDLPGGVVNVLTGFRKELVPTFATHTHLRAVSAV